jgi:RNA polymerase II-associated factor 1
MRCKLQITAFQSPADSDVHCTFCQLSNSFVANQLYNKTINQQAHRESKSKSESQTEKERKRKEHAQRILQAQKKSSKTPSKSASDATTGGSSIFQSLFNQRAEGFLIDLKFRNAPPRPPVGPCFVGLGLEGELTDKWTKYKPRNAVERQYVWKIHPEADLGVPLAVSAMDWEGAAYTDPDKKGNNQDKKETTAIKSTALHPDDDAIINWKGSLGDTAAEQLQQRRDRARAAARHALAQGYGTPLPLNKALTPIVATAASTTAFKLKKKHHLQSRILDEKTPNFMKKTTYLTNDATSVHRFTSLAKTQEERAKDVDRAIADTKSRYTESDVIEKGFGIANSCNVIAVNTKDQEEEGGEIDATPKKKLRVHPTKKDVVPVWDMPLLPDVTTWGHTYTHVVLDNPPKSIKSNAKGSGASGSNSLVNAQQLQKAIVADVTQQINNARMACTVWVPGVSEEGGERPPSGDPYQAVQRYDLDVVPLRDASGPHVHFVLVVDPNKNYVGYHPVGSRVQLSTGRPVVLAGTSRGGNDSGIATDKSVILRRVMESEEKKDVEKRMAEVDIDLAEKYGLVDEGEEDAGGKSARRRSSGNSGGKQDEEMEDTF